MKTTCTNPYLLFSGLTLTPLFAIFGFNPDSTSVDPALYRPSDASLRLDISRLREHTGWTPEYTLRRTLEDIVASCM